MGKKNTAEGNISANKSATFPSGNDITINDLIDFVNTYTNESIKINGTERAVRNSSGKRIARTEEGLRAFYDWFGDSKVTDNQGRPLVVYHGTSADFDTFDMSKAGKHTRNYTAQAGAWFTPDEAMAERFAPNVYPVYLKLGNPKIYKTGAVSSGDLALEQAEVDNAKNDGERYYAQRQLNYARKYTDAYDKFVADMFHANGEIPYRNNRTISYEDARMPEDTAGFMDKYKESLKSQGYDGIIIENTRADARRNGGENNTQYVAFAPEQIKSVQNRGSFSPDTGNIYYQSAMYRSPLKDFGRFYDDVMLGANNKQRFYTENINGVDLDFTSDSIKHANNKHNLTKEEWNGIIQALKKNKISAATTGDYTTMNGASVKMIVDVNGKEYGLIFEHMKSGRNLIRSAFPLEDNGWIRPKQKRSSQTVANKPQPESSLLGNSLSDIVYNLDKNVNNTFYQSASEREYDPRDYMPKVRGGWTKAKILRYLKDFGSLTGAVTAWKMIREFDNAEDFKAHVFYHGSKYGTSWKMFPSITMSDRTLNRVGGGGLRKKQQRKSGY